MVLDVIPVDTPVPQTLARLRVVRLDDERLTVSVGR